MTNKFHGKDLPTPKTKLNKFVLEEKYSNFIVEIHSKM